MRVRLTIGCVLLWCLTFFSPVPNQKPPVHIPDVKALLKDLSETLRGQSASQRYWVERALRDIAVLQLQAGDRKGTLESIRESQFQTIDDVKQFADSYRGDASVSNWTYRAHPGNLKNPSFELEKVLRLKNAYQKSKALRQCAVLAMQVCDLPRARKLLDQAIETRRLIRDQDDSHLLCWIADAQAEVGLIDEAFQTVSKFTNEQYHDRALQLITQYCLARYKLATALRAAEMIVNPSRKAIGMLNVAVVHAQKGNHRTARMIASRIQLSNRYRDFTFRSNGKSFDYRLPDTWGCMYEAGPAYTMAMYHHWQNQAAQVADASMMLAQLLGQIPSKPYVAEFQDVRHDVIIRALARAHAGTGDPNAALAWANQIGVSDTSESTSENDAKIHSELRIHALTGVAEGILDRTISRE